MEDFALIKKPTLKAGNKIEIQAVKEAQNELKKIHLTYVYK